MQKIGITADGAVVMDRVNSHLHECVRSMVVEALKQVSTAGRPFMEAEIDFGHIIGKSTCVDTSPEDDVVFAQRPNRRGLSRFVRNRESEPTTKVFVVLKKSDKPGEYILITAFAGGKSVVEPWDSHATDESQKFWQKKALIWDGQVVEGTTTTVCPW
jgi:hypothetical protein